MANAQSLAEAARAHRTNIQLSKSKNPIKGQGVLPCLLVYCLLLGNLKPANQAVHGTNHSKPMESLKFRCTVRRTGTACGIGTVGFLQADQSVRPKLAKEIQGRRRRSLA